MASHCNAKQGRQVYASSAAEDGRESAEEGEEEEEEGREEEEEQRPLCSGVLGYPLVRDHTLGLGLSSTPDAQPEESTQEQPYKGAASSLSFFKGLILSSRKKKKQLSFT